MTTKDPGPAAPLTPAEQAAVRASDSADTARRGPASDLSGRRLRAIPTVITRNGDVGTTVEIRKQDFASKGIDHPTVRFDARKDRYTLPVGDKPGNISEEAANFLADNYPTSFEFMGG